MAIAGNLVGRDRELAAVSEMLVVERRPVVTVWGPAGIGKTSLAAAVLAEVGPSFEGGAHFCALAGAESLADLLAVVIETLGLSGAEVRSTTDGLARVQRALASRPRTLLVLDNVEQITSPCASAIATWTRVASSTTFLVTTRELLALSGETPFELQPLALAGRDGEASEAVRLLIDRARAFRPAFDAEPQLLATIAERLDGIPLALELAAAQLAVMSAEQLAVRLGDRFAVLRRGYGGLEPRQQTLLGALAWSWNLLVDPERRALEELSVFRGGFDLEAAQAVVGEGAPALVAALRHKSLVARLDDEPNLRFTLHESVREFAARELGDRAPAVHAMHAAHFASAATSWAHPLYGDNGEDARRRLSAEHANFVVVAERFVARPSPDGAGPALACLVAAEPVASSKGASASIADLLRRSLEASRDFDVSPALRVETLLVAASVSIAIGELDRARALGEEASTIVEEAVWPGGRIERALWLSKAVGLKGVVMQTLGRVAEALEFDREALALAVESGARREQGRAVAGLGLVHHMLDDPERARRAYVEALGIHREVGDVRVEIRTRMRLGFLEQDVGDTAAATAGYHDALRLAQEYRVTAAEGLLGGYIGNAHRAEGRLAEATAAYDIAIARLRAEGDRRFEATFTMDRGIAHLLAGNARAADEDIATATAAAEELGLGVLVALSASYLVVARASLGDIEGARDAEMRSRRFLPHNPSAVGLLELHACHIALAARGDGDAVDHARAVLAKLGPHPFGQHKRIGVELLGRAVDRIAPPLNAVVLEGHRVRTPGGQWLDLARRPAAEAVVRLLVERRLATPGVAVPIAELVAVGWPGEKLVAGAGENRLRVLLSGLRAGGLKAVLVGVAGGYLLDPLTPVVHGVRSKPPD